jgi:hypothetical protein
MMKMLGTGFAAALCAASPHKRLTVRPRAGQLFRSDSMGSTLLARWAGT